MTYDRAYTQIDNLLDKTGTAYFTTTEKNQFIDLAVMEYTKGLINTLESDAQSMEKIAPLVFTSNSASPDSTNSILLGTEGIPFFHLLRAYTDKGVNINIMSNNEYAAAKNDPFHKPSSSHPVGLFVSGNKLKIIGTNDSIKITYIAKPALSADGNVTSTSTQTLGSYSVNSGEEILNIAVRKMMLSLEDPRYQLQMNELTADKR